MALHQDIESSRYVIDNVFNGAECYAICEKENNIAIGAVELKLNGYTDMTDRDEEGKVNMSGIIIYKSKYGAAKKYAKWLSEATGYACMEIKNANPKAIEGYDTVILGSGIYASGIACLPYLKKNMNILKNKRVIVFCCGASPYEEESFRFIYEHNMKNELSEIPLFYCRGSWDMDAMSFKDRTLCSLLKKAVAKKDPKDYEVWEKALMAAGDNPCDWTNQSYLAPIFEYLASECDTLL